MHGAVARTRRADVGRLLGRVVLAAIFAYAATAWCVSAAFLWSPRGSFGITTNYNGSVSAVDPGSPAAAAGIEVGDRIDIGETAFSYRSQIGRAHV